MSGRPNLTPEQEAHDAIDEQLRTSGLVRAGQGRHQCPRGRGLGHPRILHRYRPADSVRFMDRKPVGVIEAKKEDLGQNITTAEVQTGDYAAAKLKWVQNTGKPLSFLYEATGVLTRFTDQRDPKPRSREVFSFHRPKTLRKNADQPLNPNQIAWLELIRDRVLTSFLLERDDLDFAPFDARGGLGKMHQLFGDPMDPSSANSTGSWWRESRTGTFVVHETACHAQQIPLSDTDASQTPLWYSRGPQMHHKPTGSSLKMPCNRAIVLHEHQK